MWVLKLVRFGVVLNNRMMSAARIARVVDAGAGIVGEMKSGG